MPLALCVLQVGHLSIVDAQMFPLWVPVSLLASVSPSGKQG